MTFQDNPVLGKFTPVPHVPSEELRAAHERIDELKGSLAEMVGIYWGDGDGFEPPPACIQRAQAALSEEVLS
jgi:hypothetical protein